MMKKLENFLKKKVIDSGHTLEGTINKRLKKLGLNIKNEEIHYDKDEEKGRNIDFLVIDNVPSFNEKMKKSRNEIQISGQL